LKYNYSCFQNLIRKLKRIYAIMGLQRKARSELIGGIRKPLRWKNRHNFKKAEKKIWRNRVGWWE
jgi:hypothetical protein